MASSPYPVDWPCPQRHPRVVSINSPCPSSHVPSIPASLVFVQSDHARGGRFQRRQVRCRGISTVHRLIWPQPSRPSRQQCTISHVEHEFSARFSHKLFTRMGAAPQPKLPLCRPIFSKPFFTSPARAVPARRCLRALARPRPHFRRSGFRDAHSPSSCAPTALLRIALSGLYT